MYSETDSIKYSAEEREELRKLMADLKAERGAIRARYNSNERSLANSCEEIVARVEATEARNYVNMSDVYHTIRLLVHERHRLEGALYGKNLMIGKIRSELSK